MIEKKIFIGGLNSDDEDRVLPNGDYRYALNIRNGVTDEAASGSIENVKGNTKVAFPLPSGANKCIGSFSDEKNNVIIYFIWNFNGNHRILEFDTKTRQVNTIFAEEDNTDSILKFQQLSPINDIDRIDDLLYWNDRVNPPRKINIAIGKKTSEVILNQGWRFVQMIQVSGKVGIAGLTPHGLSAGDELYLSQDAGFDVADFQGKTKVDTVITTQSLILDIPWQNTINMEGYVYPFSSNIYPIPLKGKDITVIRPQPQCGPEVEAVLTTGSSTALSKDNPNVSLDNKYFQIIYKYIYFDDEESAWSSSSTLVVPDRSTTEFYESIKITVETGFEDVRKIKIAAREGDSRSENAGDFNLITTLDKTLDNIASETTYEYFFTNEEITIPIDVNETDKPFDSVPQLANAQAVLDDRRISYGGITEGYDPVDIDLRLTPIYLDSTAYPGSIPRKTFKTGALHKFGIVYYDEFGRSGKVNVTPTTTSTTTQEIIQLPFTSYIRYTTVYNGSEMWVDTISDRALTRNNGIEDVTLDWFYYVDCNFEIHHQPPDWATHYQIVYSGNTTMSDWVQIQVDAVSPFDANQFQVIGGLNAVTGDFNTEYSYTWSFAEGDMVRLLTASAFGNANNFPFFGEQNTQTFKVTDFDESTNIATVAEFLPGVSLDIGAPEWVEVFRPRKELQDEVYYEIGECYPIINPGESDRYHGGGDASLGGQDQTSSQPAIVYLTDQGDAYRRETDTALSSRTGWPITIPFDDYLVESKNIEDERFSDFFNFGKPNISDLDQKRIFRPSTIFYSDTYIPETNINGLSSFFENSFKQYDPQYGAIQKMYSEDTNLLVFQELKVGNVLVNESRLYSNEGTPIGTVGQEGVILNDIIYYVGEFGIGKNPESFAVYGNRKYFIDVTRRAVLRLSNNGITPISEFKMHNFFNDKFSEVINTNSPTNNGFRIYGSYDVRFGEYVLAIEDISSFTTIPGGSGQLGGIVETIILPGVTLTFDEAKNRWSSFRSYLPDNMVDSTIGLITFFDGDLYIENDNPTYNNFYGTQYSSEIDVHANIEPDNVKFFKALSEKSITAWESPQITNQYGQNSELITSDFEDKQGEYYAAFLRDKNTPNASNTTEALINGDVLRSHALVIRLKNSSINYERLFSVGIESELSQFTK